MAKSPAHKFGQIIGDLLEATIEPLLLAFAQDNSLYLDKKGYRTARRGNKVTWTDLSGNRHDLDFVLEMGGTELTMGVPVAFIESAWRRYTRHSRNKAQEIQGAVLPLQATYKDNPPFIGAILAGVFTDGAINQLKSLGFSVLYFPYSDVVEAFRGVGIDVNFDESTPDYIFDEKITLWESLSPENKAFVSKALIKRAQTPIDEFFSILKIRLERKISKVIIWPLYGRIIECETISQALNFLEGYSARNEIFPLVKFEVEIRYNNGDLTKHSFTNKEMILQTLNGYLSVK